MVTCIWFYTDSIPENESFQNLQSTIFRDIMPCSPLSVNRRFGGTYRLPEDGTLHNHRCENLISYFQHLFGLHLYAPKLLCVKVLEVRGAAML
jgi:hypothetical protein